MIEEKNIKNRSRHKCKIKKLNVLIENMKRRNNITIKTRNT